MKHGALGKRRKPCFDSHSVSVEGTREEQEKFVVVVAPSGETAGRTRAMNKGNTQGWRGCNRIWTQERRCLRIELNEAVVVVTDKKRKRAEAKKGTVFWLSRLLLNRDDGVNRKGIFLGKNDWWWQVRHKFLGLTNEASSELRRIKPVSELGVNTDWTVLEEFVD